ncbi:hypothetical protein [Azospirillum palustre]
MSRRDRPCGRTAPFAPHTTGRLPLRPAESGNREWMRIAGAATMAGL